LIGVSFLPLYGFSTSIGRKAWDARFSHDFGIRQAKDIEERCVVLSHVSTMFMINDVRSAQTYFMKNPSVRKQIIERSDGCLYFYHGYWCNAERFEEGICSWMQENYGLEVVANESKRGKDFIFYRVKT
ncbi:MAG: hypothetical protein ABEJ72_10355, partial [Candidatus Aenigmatarchaeota archaeon]